MIPKGAPVFIQLGRFGDLIQLLPAWKAIHDRAGADPIVMVSTDYSSIFDGVSYVQPFPIHGHWFAQIPFARELAKQHFGGAVIPQWWHETDRAEEIMAEQGTGATVLQCHGFNWGVDMSKAPSYGVSMWKRCGFTRDEMMSLPLVFDRRSPSREAALAELVLGKNQKPVVLYNFTGVSSPFAYVPEVMRTVMKYTNKFKFIDIGKIVAHRIYDLLGLYDRAVGLITIDSATTHLAPAAKLPYFAYLVDGWSQSVPKGNVRHAIPYSQCLPRLAEMDAFLSTL